MSSGTALRKVQPRDLLEPRKALGGEPIENRSAMSFDLAIKRGGALYRATKKPAPAADVLVFPSLLAPEAQRQMSRLDVVDEIRLLLEGRQPLPLPEDTYVYSLRAVEPTTFRPSPQLLDLLRSFDQEASSNVRAGYVTHDLLYGLSADEGRLASLLTAFLACTTVVEVKVRRQPEPERVVRVSLSD